MNGRKAAIILIGVIVLSAFAAAIAIKIFFATYEPKEENEAKEIGASDFFVKEINHVKMRY